MTKIMKLAAVLPLLAGCLGSRPNPPTCWLVSAEEAEVRAVADIPPRDSARIGSLTVRPPYDGAKFAVLRPDGSVAFDPANAFAVKPELMLKGAACDVLASRGDFDFVRSQSATNVVFDITVTKLALDCRREGMRKASVGVAVVARTQCGRGQSVSTRACAAESSSDAAGGKYSAAFSKAFSTALVRAYEGTKER